MEPPFLFDSCQGARPNGIHVNHELVQDGWCWWYRRYAPEDRILDGLEKDAPEAKKGLRVDPGL
jgi:endonuclease YncB( thermonuclease family)